MLHSMGSQGVRHDRATEQNMQKGYGVAEDEMVRQHQQLNGHEFEETLGDRGTWHAPVHGVAKSQIRLSDKTTTYVITSIWPCSEACAILVP